MTRSRHRSRLVLSLLGVVVGLGAGDWTLGWAQEKPTVEVIRLQREAETLFVHGYIRQAIVVYQKILTLKPKFVPALRDLAWIRGTTSDPGLRRPKEAIRLAETAFETLIVSFNSRPGRGGYPPNYDQVQIVQVGAALAAGYASAGRFKAPPRPNEQVEVPPESDVMAATAVAVWGVEMASALEERNPTPQMAKLAADMRELLAVVLAERPIDDGRPLPGTGVQGGRRSR